MNFTSLCTRHWPSVAVAVALVGLFGLLSITALPIQLLPTIEQPQVSIQNFWRAAAPEEMESTIIEPQENVLRNTPGVTDISSFISRGAGFVTLTQKPVLAELPWRDLLPVRFQHWRPR